GGNHKYSGASTRGWARIRVAYQAAPSRCAAEKVEVVGTRPCYPKRDLVKRSKHLLRSGFLQIDILVWFWELLPQFDQPFITRPRFLLAALPKIEISPRPLHAR